MNTEKDPCVQPQFSQVLLCQISKVRSVLNSSGKADYETDLTYRIWWRFDGVNDHKRTFLENSVNSGCENFQQVFVSVFVVSG